MDVVVLEVLPALEEGELDRELDPDDLAAELGREVTDRACGATGREHVVVHEDARSVVDRVGMQLE